MAVSGHCRKGMGMKREADVVDPYLAFLRENIQVGPIKRRVVVDGGNGVGGLVAPQAYRAMGHEVIPLFCEPDGRFPNHHPDPTLPKNLHTLIEKVKESGADLGIGFDGDADRIGVILWSSQGLAGGCTGKSRRRGDWYHRGHRGRCSLSSADGDGAVMDVSSRAIESLDIEPDFATGVVGIAHLANGLIVDVEEESRPLGIHAQGIVGL